MILICFGLFILLILGIIPSVLTSFKSRVACIFALLGGAQPLVSLLADSFNIKNIVIASMGAFGPLVFFFSAFLIFLISGKTQAEFRSCIICFIGTFLGFALLIFITVVSAAIGA